MIPTDIYGRDAEIAQLRQVLSRQHSVLLYGEAGVGKTLLLKHLVDELPEMLYCSESWSSQMVFRALATELLAKNNESVIKACGHRRQNAINEKSAVSLRGIVSEALRDARCWIVLDHLRAPSPSFAGTVKGLIAGTEVSLVAAARTEHMEDVGYLLPVFSDRSKKYALRNFDSERAAKFAVQIAQKVRLDATNQAEVIEKVVSYSKGNPGAIIAMLQMAVTPKYLNKQHVKISPLYIDFRLSWGTTHG
jgi:Cdc6-like AAA superfamily ATPase